MTARSSLVLLAALCSFTRFGFSSILSDCLAFGFKCRSIGLRYDFGTEACQWSTNPDDSCELPVLRRAGLAVWADGWMGGWVAGRGAGRAFGSWTGQGREL